MQSIDGHLPTVDLDPTTLIRHIVVVCNGTPAGDNALRLSEDISQATSATVRAVAWLPSSLINAHTSPRHGPIEAWLDHVTEQLYRATRLPGLWRLTLLVGDQWSELARVCNEELADLVIMPEADCLAASGTRLMTNSGIPVACTTNTDDNGIPHVLLRTGPDLRCQRTAHLVSAILAVLRTHPRLPNRDTPRFEVRIAPELIGQPTA